jgi:hypothetical protein
MNFARFLCSSDVTEQESNIERSLEGLEAR